MKILKKIGLILLLALIVIQFVRPTRNESKAVLATDIRQVTSVPPNVQNLLSRSCYDCHSNNTRYPWYMNIQPVAWYLADHVKEGKRELNFSEFGSYTSKKQRHKLEEISKEVQEGEMPLSSYTLIHGDAKLSDAERTIITTWADSLFATYPTPAPESK